MAISSVTTLGVSALILWICFVGFSISTFTVSAEQVSLFVLESTTLRLSPGLLVENSPGSKPVAKVLCERVQIHGLSRQQHIKKFANSVKVKVTYVNSTSRTPNVEVCFHRNASLGIGMCPQGHWEKLVKGSWSKSMSPFDHKLLDIRVAGSSSATLGISLYEEFFLYRVVFLAVGTLLLTLASFLSKCLVFYYGGAMTIGVILVILIVLFQGMKLLPTGRKNSLAIFLYSSLVGLGSFLLRYIPRFLRSVLLEFGIDEDMYNPLTIFLCAFLILAGAWLGFWVVRKLVLTEDGSIDMGVSNFVAWSIRIFASVMILQSSVDPLLAAEALFCGILFSSVLRRITRPRFMRHIYKKLCRTEKGNSRYQKSYSSPIVDSYNYRPNTPIEGSTIMTPSQLSDSETFYSSFHKAPERRKISKEEWEKFTSESTKKALEELVSSPDFSRWAVSHADRIMLAPKKDTVHQRSRWFPWL